MASGALLRRLLKARDLLHAQVSRGVTLDELARQAGLSRAHLARQFSDTFGVPPHQYLVQLRLDLAKRALAGGAPVTEVCHEVGFESLGTFSTSFRKRVGLSPRAYQQVTRPFVQSLGVPILYIPSCFFSFEHV